MLRGFAKLNQLTGSRAIRHKRKTIDLSPQLPMLATGKSRICPEANLIHDKANESKPRVSRREFARSTALAAAAAALAPATSLSHAKESSPSSSASALPQQQGPDLSDLSPQARAEIDAKVENVIRRWGDRLSDEQKTRARTVITRHVRMLETVRKFPLHNGDSPASVLKLFAAAPGATVRPSKPAH